MRTRVLIVDDSELFIAELGRLLAAADGFEVVGTAPHGLAALELAEALRPDLVTLDVRMPVMDGVTTLKHLMTRRPVATVMLSAWTTEESHLTFECLRYGAVDFMAKPSGAGAASLAERREQIAAGLRRAAGVTPPCLKFCRVRPIRTPPRAPENRPARQVVLVNAGRGGLTAVLKLVSRIPGGLDAGFVVALDLPPVVVESFALYLARFCPQAIVAPAEGTVLQAGAVFLVSASRPHLVVREEGIAHLRSFAAPAEVLEERLLEALFNSVAEDFRDQALAVLLAGAGPGALQGLQRILEARGTTLVQAPAAAPDPELLAAAVQGKLATQVGEPESLAGNLFTELLRRRG
ncbi:MAG: chemotaxis protein CheB [bacterium]|nr:chemotaxis protein CheB [bacterium]